VDATELFTGTLTSSAVAMHFESAKKVQVFPGACEGTGSYSFSPNYDGRTVIIICAVFLFTVVYGSLHSVQVFGLYTFLPASQ
jgi:hypothetical protein